MNKKKTPRWALGAPYRIGKPLAYASFASASVILFAIILLLKNYLAL